MTTVPLKKKGSFKKWFLEEFVVKKYGKIFGLCAESFIVWKLKLNFPFLRVLNLRSDEANFEIAESSL